MGSVPDPKIFPSHTRRSHTRWH